MFFNQNVSNMHRINCIVAVLSLKIILKGVIMVSKLTGFITTCAFLYAGYQKFVPYNMQRIDTWNAAVDNAVLAQRKQGVECVFLACNILTNEHVHTSNQYTVFEKYGNETYVNERSRECQKFLEHFPTDDACEKRCENSTRGCLGRCYEHFYKVKDSLISCKKYQECAEKVKSLWGAMPAFGTRVEAFFNPNISLRW